MNEAETLMIMTIEGRKGNDLIFEWCCYSETNLKCRQCLTETADMGQEPEKLGSFNGEIICEPPNNHLNKVSINSHLA